MPLPDYEDAMSVDARPAGQTPLPAGDDLMNPSQKLTSILEDPAPELQASVEDLVAPSRNFTIFREKLPYPKVH